MPYRTTWMRKVQDVKKDLKFSSSKNSMTLSNSSAKENANEESKNENESGIQNE